MFSVFLCFTLGPVTGKSQWSLDQKRIIVFDTVLLNSLMDLKLLLRNPWQLAKGPQKKEGCRRFFFISCLPIPVQLGYSTPEVLEAPATIDPSITQNEGPVLLSWLETRDVPCL